MVEHGGGFGVVLGGERVSSPDHPETSAWGGVRLDGASEGADADPEREKGREGKGGEVAGLVSTGLQGLAMAIVKDD